MQALVWNILVGTPLAGSLILFVLLIYLPGIAPRYALPIALGLVAIALAIAAMRNRVTIGSWTRTVTPAQRQLMDARIRRSTKLRPVVFVALLPVVFVMVSLGYGKGAVMIASLVCGAIFAWCSLYLYRLSRRSS
ncbi:hypothetical protein [Bradyrhizobium macuxiense]|nr:hypothetical protein [Bradyrhizobium macuxiense]